MIFMDNSILLVFSLGFALLVALQIVYTFVQGRAIAGRFECAVREIDGAPPSTPLHDSHPAPHKLHRRPGL